MTRQVGVWQGAVLFLLLLLSGCIPMGPTPVTPADIPDLEDQVAGDPENPEFRFRLGAALAAANRCEEAIEAAEEGRALDPGDPAGVLVIGRCREASGDLDGALRLYGQYTNRYRDGVGAAVIEGQRALALQRRAREVARLAVAVEETLPPADPETVGVLPFLVDGDPEYQPLSVGLAHMLTTDLALLQRFTMVERAELSALLQEMQIPREMVDPESAARTGRLLRASRMVLGTLSVPSERGTRLGGNIVLETGELTEPATLEGDLSDLLALEKTYALQVAEQLGYQLSMAERQRILENQPGSLAAFLAFSKGLLEEDLGNYENAAGYFRDAVRADPAYEEAQEGLRRAVSADFLSTFSLGDAPVMAQQIESALGVSTGPTVITSTLASAVFDLASHQAERATWDVGTASSIVAVVPDDPFVLPLMEAFILIVITIPR